MTREQIIKHWDVIQAFKEGKQIQYRYYESDEWEDIDMPSFVIYFEYRIKPTTTKRLPTIEEVEKWFMENKVFKSNCGRYLQKISSLHRAPINTLYIRIGCGSLTIKDFVSHYKHYNGTELYITE